MYKRKIADYLLEIATKFPIITLIGPRQSGKSTLCRAIFPQYKYISLEDPDIRNLAINDPRGFFKSNDSDLVLDEIQRAPDLLSYIQTIVDNPQEKRKFVLTGSQQILLMEKITQSLAGRTAIAKLLPFSREELWEKNSSMTVDQFMLTGGYPRIYDKNLEPTQWLQQYYATYIERDVRSIINIGHKDQFERFIMLSAGRAGQLLNLSSLSNDCGVSQPTARSWLSALQASFICFTLKPHYKNFSKRVIKTPKLYFYDTGLLCYLLKINDINTLSIHPLRGSIFENWVVSETLKKYYNQGKEPPVYFFRNQKGHEIDLVIDNGLYLYPIEIKSSYTANAAILKNLEYFSGLQKYKTEKNMAGEAVYCGEKEIISGKFTIKPWNMI